MRKVAFVAALSPVVLAAIACGGGNTGGSGGTSTSTATGGATTSSTTSTSTTSTGGTTTSSSATTGGGGASSTTSTTTTSGTGVGGGACQWNAGADPCGAGTYCNAPDCDVGVCAPLGASETSDRAPVCGCDGVTYWNGSVAASHGMAVQGAGVCSAGKTCGGFAGKTCPATTLCSYQVADASMCGGADMPGTCWALPAACPQTAFGWQTRGCGASMCSGECTLIKKGGLWYVDGSCPQ